MWDAGHYRHTHKHINKSFNKKTQTTQSEQTKVVFSYTKKKQKQTRLKSHQYKKKRENPVIIWLKFKNK